MFRIKTLIVLSLFVGTSLFAHSKPTTQHLSANEFKSVIDSKKYLLIDVRTPDEFAEGHIAGAININVNDDDFVDKIKAQTKKIKMIAIYCRSGRRSKVAISLIEALKLQIVELNNGYISWN